MESKRHRNNRARPESGTTLWQLDGSWGSGSLVVSKITDFGSIPSDPAKVEMVWMIETKVCSSCKVEKPALDFGKKSASKDGLQSMCKVCHNEYNKVWYSDVENHRAQRVRVTEYNSRARKITQDNIIEYLVTHPCVDCGETDPIILEFDHRDPSEKSFEIGEMNHLRLAWRRIELEIQKCDVRCCNCHRRRTSAQFGHWRTLRLETDILP